jgi:RNA polymerase sigma-70 factor (ECF subfamily)
MTGADEFEAFVRRYQDMVYATAVRLTGNPAEAEDIAQTVFLKAFQRFAEIGSSEAAAGWLKTVTRNACINHLTRYRSRWRLFSELDRESTSPGGGRVEAFDESLGTDESPASIFDRSDAHERLEAALAALPDHQRVPIVLFHFEEMSYQDIASTLGISLGKLKTDIHRGREALRAQLTRHEIR